MLWVLIRTASARRSNEYPQNICFYGEISKNLSLEINV